MLSQRVTTATKTRSLNHISFQDLPCHLQDWPRFSWTDLAFWNLALADAMSYRCLHESSCGRLLRGSRKILWRSLWNAVRGLCVIWHRSLWEALEDARVKSSMCPYMIWYRSLRQDLVEILLQSSSRASRGPCIKILKMLCVGACMNILLGCS